MISKKSKESVGQTGKSVYGGTRNKETQIGYIFQVLFRFVKCFIKASDVLTLNLASSSSVFLTLN